MGRNTREITVTVDRDLVESLDEYADDCYEGNRSMAVREALRRLIQDEVDA